MPSLHIITGSNGAGKSSVGSIYLPGPISLEFPIFDGDKLFVEKRNELWKTIKSPKEARNLAYAFVTERFDELVDEALNKKTHLVYEGHFTHDSTWSVPRRFKENGYKIQMIFLGLKDIETSELRVLDRVKEGGHYVDRITIENNFYGNLEKLNQYFHLIDDLLIVDTTGDHKVVAHLINGKAVVTMHTDQQPNWFKQNLPLIAEKINIEIP